MRNRKRSRSVAYNDSEFEIVSKQKEASELARYDREKKFYKDIDDNLKNCFNIIKYNEENSSQIELLSNLLKWLGPYSVGPLKLKGKCGHIMYVNLAGAAAASNKINFMKAIIEFAPHTLYQHSFPIHTINMQSDIINISITKLLLSPLKAGIVNRNFEMLSLILDQHKSKAFSSIMISDAYKQIASLYIEKSEIELKIINLFNKTLKYTYLDVGSYNNFNQSI